MKRFFIHSVFTFFQTNPVFAFCSEPVSEPDQSINDGDLKSVSFGHFKKTTDFQSNDQLVIPSKPSSFYFSNCFIILVLLITGFCSPFIATASEFSWGEYRSKQRFSSYDEACESIRSELELYWKTICPVPKSCRAVITSLRPKSNGACMGPGAFDESGPRHYSCGGPFTTLFSKYKPNGDGYGSCINVYRLGETCAAPKVLDQQTGSCQLPAENPKNPTDGCATVGNPVNLLTGNKSLKQTDYQSIGTSPLQFIRHYNSQKSYLYQSNFSQAGTTRNPVGMGWYHNYYKGLTIINGSTIKLTLADGQAFLFKRSNSLWIPDADVDYRLEEIRTDNIRTGWKLLTPDQTTETYNPTGLLTSIRSRHGISQYLSYRKRLLIKVSDSFGKSLSFSYNYANKLVSLTDPNQNVTQYQYDNLNNLVAVIYPDLTPLDQSDNPRKQYLYGELNYTENIQQPHVLTGIIDENNHRFATYQYNASGQAISTEHASGGINKYSLSYHPEDLSTQVIDPLGTAYTTHYTSVLGVMKKSGNDQPAGSGCHASSSAITYDENGNIKSNIDFNGNLTQHEYDTLRNLEIARIEAFGTPEQRTIKTEWHPEFRLPVQIDVLDSLDIPVYRLSLEYDTAGLLLSRTTTDISNQASRSTKLSYNSLGLIANVDGPRTDVSDITLYEYDEQGNLIKIMNALEHETILSDYDASGRVHTITDPNGLVTQLSYHPRGWISSLTINNQTTTFDYDPVGQLIKLTRPDAVYTLYHYDEAHRLTGITDNLGNSIHYTLDAMGNRLKEQVKDDSGNITRVLEQEYDQLSRVLLSIGGENQTKHYQYDANGNPTIQSDPRQTSADRNTAKTIEPLEQDNTTLSVFDALNRLKLNLHHHNYDDSSDDVQSDYEYNSLDQLVSVIDPNGFETRYKYNALGDLLQINSPDTGITNYRYDQAGNRINQTDARNVTVNYYYDALNRLTEIHYPDSLLNVTYHYDESNHGSYGIGRLTHMTDASGITKYLYDQSGNLTTVSTSQEGTVLDTLYAYNEVDQLTQMTYPNGRIVDYNYDDSGRIVAINTTDDHGKVKNLLSNVEYLPFGPVTQMLLGNGLTAQHDFDLDYRQKEINTTPVFARSYDYDEADNITHILNELDNSEDQMYTYDGLSRLNSALGKSDNLIYHYDATSNQTLRKSHHQTELYQYSEVNHHLTSVNQNKHYQYDENGNTIRLPHITTDLTYAENNRLSNVNGVHYTYNGQGERIKKTHSNGEVTWYHYNPNGQLISETDKTGLTQKEYIYFNSQLIALASAKKTRPTVIKTPALQEISLNHRWKTLDYEDKGDSTVVFAGTPTHNGKQPGVIRIKNVGRTGAKVAFKEWNYLNGRHKTEQVSLLTLSPGRYTMPDGSLWEIGTFSLSGTQKWRNYTFGREFPATPKIFLTAQTANGRDTVTVRAKAITKQSFKAALFEQESKNRSGHVFETIAYLAIYSPTGEGTVNLQDTNLPYQLTTAQVNHQWTSVADHSIKLEEEQSKDRERRHIDETIAVLNINGHLFAQDNSSQGRDTVAIRRNSTSEEPELSLPESTEIEVYFVHNDHLQTPHVITDDNQKIVWQANYDPYGQAKITTEEITNNIRFPGQYYDQETGLHYNYFRYYDPSIGRYITSDPIGLQGGFNTYAYVGGNPLTYYDPYGLFGMDDVWGGIYTATGGWSPSQNTVNITAGFGDGISSVLTFGLYSTADFRNSYGINGGINECDASYEYSKYAGHVWGFGTIWAGGLNGGSNSVFWSGFNKNAMEAAKKVGITLEKTPIGSVLTSVSYKIRLPEIVWDIASATFAANAKGSVKAIIRNQSTKSTWVRYEQKILQWRNIPIIKIQ